MPLARGRDGRIFFKPVLRIDILSSSCEIGLRWVRDKSHMMMNELVSSIAFIILNDVDPGPCGHMVSLDFNELS